MIKVKICGITNLEDAQFAIDAGADMLGFVFYKGSPRYISAQNAKEIISKLKGAVEKVALFVNEKKQIVDDIAAQTGQIDILQFHGDESADYCRGFSKKTIKAIRVKNEASLQGLEHYDVDFFLLDSFKEGLYGGTATAFNWEIAKKANAYNKPIIISGGLNPSNVAKVIELVRPYAVDVSSGVEISPGEKGHKLIEKFIREAKK